MKTASWIIVDNATGAAVLETFNAKLVAAVNTQRYTAVPILLYLCNLNKRIRQSNLKG